jgi:ferritin
MATYTEIKASSSVSEKCIEMLQKRHFEEEKTSRLYEDMYMLLDNLGYTDCAPIWHKWAHERIETCDWARKYLANIGIRPIVAAIPAPECSCTDLPSVIRDTLQNELALLQQYQDFAACALEAKDFMTFTFVQKYLTYQNTALGQAQTLSDRLAISGTTKESLLLLAKWIEKTFK